MVRKRQRKEKDLRTEITLSKKSWKVFLLSFPQDSVNQKSQIKN